METRRLREELRHAAAPASGPAVLSPCSVMPNGWLDANSAPMIDISADRQLVLCYGVRGKDKMRLRSSEAITTLLSKAGFLYGQGPAIVE